MKQLTLIAACLTAFATLLNAQPQAGGNNECLDHNQQFRNARDQWMKTSPNAPLDQADRAQFNGLFYYPVDCSYVFDGGLFVHDQPVKTSIATTDGGTVQLIDYGKVRCNIKGVDHEFTVYKNIDLPDFKDYTQVYFIPFRDATSVEPVSTTNASGRYLLIDLPVQGNRVTLDFNKAVNPFENYNSSFSSLLSPAANVITAPLMVGERKYEDRTN
jgi:uncharacterized protein